jgi:hypothetical protein
MKIILEFEDLEDAQIYLDAQKYYLTIFNFKNYLRNKLKHEDLTEIDYEITENISDVFNELLNDNNVSI